ncbi:hypothetical protein N7493_000992 [Penicillium malachiteum]|uniref:Uncharacterized protein n=1 Tax=Penicillium malachiteum TaxID=1324776 RepID=A0AAD6HXF9_9EURO|nr:hypothetical protein N7493_000992 [Penicillium malachiteum]
MREQKRPILLVKTLSAYPEKPKDSLWRFSKETDDKLQRPLTEEKIPHFAVHLESQKISDTEKLHKREKRLRHKRQNLRRVQRQSRCILPDHIPVTGFFPYVQWELTEKTRRFVEREEWPKTMVALLATQVGGYITVNRQWAPADIEKVF